MTGEWDLSAGATAPPQVPGEPEVPAPSPYPAEPPVPAEPAVPDAAPYPDEPEVPAEPAVPDASPYPDEPEVPEASPYPEEPPIPAEPELPGEPPVPAPSPVLPEPPTGPEPAVASAGARLCSSCKAPNPEGARFCSQCGTPLSGGGGTMMLPRLDAGAPAGAGTQVFGAQPQGRAKLILIRGEGFEGAEFRLGADEVKSGRSQGLVLFPSDATLAPHHATWLYEAGRLHLRDEGSETGTWVRVRTPVELAAGDELVVGSHRLRFAGPVSASQPPPADGTRPLGPAAPDGAVRIEEILEGGRPGRAWIVTGPTVRLGRTGADIALPKDPFVSLRHCELQVRGDRALLSDPGSVNGTFVRLPAGRARPVNHGDYVLMGRQVLRVELAR